MPSVARAARLFLTTITWMFLLRSSARSRMLALASRPTMFTSSASCTSCSRPRRCSVIRFFTYLLMSDSCALAHACGQFRLRPDRLRQLAIRTLGLIVALMVIPLMYCPRTAAGLRLTTWLMKAGMLSASFAASKLSLPTTA